MWFRSRCCLFLSPVSAVLSHLRLAAPATVAREKTRETIRTGKQEGDAQGSSLLTSPSCPPSLPASFCASSVSSLRLPLWLVTAHIHILTSTPARTKRKRNRKKRSTRRGGRSCHSRSPQPPFSLPLPISFRSLLPLSCLFPLTHVQSSLVSSGFFSPGFCLPPSLFCQRVSLPSLSSSSTQSHSLSHKR